MLKYNSSSKRTKNIEIFLHFQIRQKEKIFQAALVNAYSRVPWSAHRRGCRRPQEGVEVVALEGKGQGLLATRAFHPGEVVLAEEPLMVVAEGEPVYQILQRFDLMGEEERAALVALYDPGEGEEVPGVTNPLHRCGIVW